MAVQQEFWKREIINRLPQVNPHMALAVNADDMVLGGSVVHIPQAGSGTTTLINPAYPLTTVQRSDTDVTYALDTFAKPVTAVTAIEQGEISYQKMDSVMENELGSLLDDVGTWLIYRWALGLPTTSAFRVPTTGGNRAAGAPGATGTRKRATEADIIAAKKVLDDALVPMKGRVLMLSSSHYNDLLLDTNLKNYFQNVVAIAKGEIPELYGFKVMWRNTVVRVAAANTVKAPNAANAVDDNEASLIWHPQMVEEAIGDVRVFERRNDPEWQGDLVSFSIKNGGRRRRGDNVGVALLTDAA